MSQRERRREPYPWTWEPTAVVCTVLVVILIVAAQLGRAAANLAVGGSPLLPPTAAGWVTSTPAVLTSHATAGLVSSGGPAAGPGLLGWSIAVTAALLVSATVAGAAVGWRRWGSGGMHGVARPFQVRAALGVRRLRRSRRQLRPDLFPPQAEHEKETEE